MTQPKDQPSKEELANRYADRVHEFTQGGSLFHRQTYTKFLDGYEACESQLKALQEENEKLRDAIIPLAEEMIKAYQWRRSPDILVVNIAKALIQSDSRSAGE